jgi:hypothetical protein
VNDDREQIARQLAEAAIGTMPPWQARLFAQLMKAAQSGRPLVIPRPPRGTLPPITVDAPTRHPRARRPKPARPTQRSLPL